MKHLQYARLLSAIEKLAMSPQEALSAPWSVGEKEDHSKSLSGYMGSDHFNANPERNAIRRIHSERLLNKAPLPADWKPPQLTAPAPAAGGAPAMQSINSMWELPDDPHKQYDMYRAVVSNPIDKEEYMARHQARQQGIGEYERLSRGNTPVPPSGTRPTAAASAAAAAAPTQPAAPQDSGVRSKTEALPAAADPLKQLGFKGLDTMLRDNQATPSSAAPAAQKAPSNPHMTQSILDKPYSPAPSGPLQGNLTAMGAPGPSSRPAPPIDLSLGDHFPAPVPKPQIGVPRKNPQAPAPIALSAGELGLGPPRPTPRPAAPARPQQHVMPAAGAPAASAPAAQPAPAPLVARPMPPRPAPGGYSMVAPRPVTPMKVAMETQQEKLAAALSKLASVEVPKNNLGQQEQGGHLMDPPKSAPGRAWDPQTLTPGVMDKEEIGTEGLLSRLFEHSGDSRSHAAASLESYFPGSKSGKYVLRERSMLEKVSSVIGRP